MSDPRISTASPQPLHVPIGCCPSFVNPRRCEDVPVEAAKLEAFEVDMTLQQMAEASVR